MKSNKYIQKQFINALLSCALLVIAGINVTHAATAETITYYHNNLLGSPVAATDDAGAVLWREQYQPYGKKLLKEPASRTNKVDYTGHLYDKDLGLVYAGARYYDPDLGRFTSMDPVGFQEGNVHSFNKYAYGNNNPYKYIDPNGESAISNLYIGKSDMQGILSGQLDQDFFEGRAEAYATIVASIGAAEIVGAKIFSGLANSLKNAKWFQRFGNTAKQGINITSKQLQKKFKHAKDFGVEGNFNKANADKFSEAIQKHVSSSKTKEIKGVYRGNPVTFHTNPKTGLTVIKNPNGNFLSGWKLNPQQLHHVLKDAKL